MKLSNGKPYKHIRLVPLSNIKRVIDIKERESKWLLSECYLIQNQSLGCLYVLVPLVRFGKR
jgi:hypothetical protein